MQHLSLGLPPFPSLSPPLSTSLFGLLSSLINDHFADVQSTLNTQCKCLIISSDVYFEKIVEKIHLFFQGLEVKISIGKVHRGRGTENCNTRDLPHLQNKNIAASQLSDEVINIAHPPRGRATQT